MHGKHLYDYAVVRVVPKVEREEFINVGILVYSKKAKYIRFIYKLNMDRLNAFSQELDLDLLKKSLQTFDRISRGDKSAGLIAQMDMGERFWWLTAVRSSCLQTSRPHPGFSKDLDKTAEKLFEELVL